jgi:hypothetical protein
MNVTAKKPGASAVYEVVDEGSRYYTAKGEFGFLIVLAKADYEPVEEWVDVTHMRDGVSAKEALRSTAFRLVRHTVADLQNEGRYYAYLLERKQ